jgi:hypothetical protein
LLTKLKKARKADRIGAGRRKASDGRESSAADWVKALATDCKPIRSKAVEDIKVEDIKRVVQPFWDQGHTVTAKPLLNRIELVVDYAIAHGWKQGDNPARWSIFQHIAPLEPKNGARPHHAALAWQDMPAFHAA